MESEEEEQEVYHDGNTESEINIKEENKNRTVEFIRTILLELCSNFNAQQLPEDEWSCKIRHDDHYNQNALKGKTLQLTTIQRLPLSGVVKDDNGTLHGVGVVFEIFHDIQEKIGFYYNITMPEKNAIGSENEGIIGLLSNKEVDMAVAFIPIIQSFRNSITYSKPLTEFEWVLLMSRPGASASASGLLAPFQTEVWIFILISLIIAGPSMYLITYLTKRFSDPSKPFKNHYTLDSCSWFVYGALMKQGSTLNPQYDGPRIFFATWWIFITILTSFYTANLTAFLTLSQFTLPIETTADIYRHQRRWMIDSGGFEEALINFDDSFEYLHETFAKYGKKTNDTLHNRLDNIQHGEIYISERRKADRILLKDYLNKTRADVPENERCTYVITPKPILLKSMAFAYQKDSYLKSILDPLLDNFVIGGMITQLLQSDLPSTRICPLQLGNNQRKLSNSDLATTYVLVIVGFASAFLAFVGETVHRFLKKKKGMVQGKQEGNFDYRKSFGDNIKNIIFVQENKEKAAANENFFIHEYYKELMPFSYRDSQNFARESNLRFLASERKPQRILYQFIH